MASSKANFSFNSKESAARLEKLGQRGGYFGLVQVITYSYLLLPPTVDGAWTSVVSFRNMI